MPPDLRTALAHALGPAVVLGEELGGGAMARVFRARDTALGRDIVVKVLAPELAGEVSAERFRREIAVAASLVHPQVVPVLAAGDADGMPWYTMPFVAGASLARRMAEGPALGGIAAVSVLRDVARALAAAHAQGVVHRDVKPGNVLLVGDAAVVTDFGIAKAVDAARRHTGTHDGVQASQAGHAAHAPTLTRAGMAIGTPAYMAPEQVAGDAVDARADVYAWGVVAYELLAGRHPFPEATTTQRVLAAHLSETPAPIGDVARGTVPGMDDVVMRALAKDPRDRHADGGALLAAIDAALTGERGVPATARGAKAGAPRGPSPRLVRGAIVLAVLAVGAEAVLYARGARAARAGAGPAAVAAPDSADATPLLAVLPFNTIGAAPDSGFAEGLADAVSNKLARLAGLRVIDRASVLALGPRADDPRAIGTELGARVALRATIRWATGADGKPRVQVTPVVVRTRDGTTLWSGVPIEASPTDPFAMQATMATQVADALDVAIAAVEREQLRTPATADPEAWAAFQRARRIMDGMRRLGGDTVWLGRAVAGFADATARDPDFLEARAWHGVALHLLAQRRTGGAAARAQATAELQAVVARDPGVFPANGYLAQLALEEGRTAEAMRLAEAAIAARPSSGTLQLVRAFVASSAGDTSTARDAILRAVALSPRDPEVLRGAGTSAVAALRDSALGNELLDRALRLAPDDATGHLDRMVAAGRTGDTVTMERAWRAVRRALPIRPGQLGMLRRGPAALQAEALAATLRSVGAATTLDSVVYHEEKYGLHLARGDSALARAHMDSALVLESHLVRDGLPRVERIKDRYLRTRVLAAAGRTAAARALLDSLAQPGVRGDTVALEETERAMMVCAQAQARAVLGDAAPMFALLRDCLLRPAGRWPAWVRREPEFAPYLRDPRMVRLLAEAEPRVVPQAVRR